MALHSASTDPEVKYKAEAGELTSLLTEYGKEWLQECKSTSSELMNLKECLITLVNQQYRQLRTCGTIEEICGDITDTCWQTEDIEEPVLAPMLDELNEYLIEMDVLRKESEATVQSILDIESHSSRRFKQFQNYLSTTKGAWSCMRAAAPDGLAAWFMRLCGHEPVAGKMCQALFEDSESRQAPVELLNTCRTNMGDSLKAMKEKAGKLGASRAMQVIRRMELVQEELNAIRGVACANFMNLAKVPTVAASFSIVEQRRHQLVQTEYAKFAAEMASTSSAGEPPNQNPPATSPDV